MLIGCSLSSYFPHPAAVALKLIREAGLSFVECDWSQEQAEQIKGAEVRNLLDNQQLKPLSVRLQGGDFQREHLKPLQIKLQQAVELGAGYVVCGAGRAENEGQRQELSECHLALADMAEKLGLVVGLETAAGVCENSREMFKWMERLQHPALRLDFDTARYLYLNDGASGEIALQRVCGYVGGLHLTDSQGMAGVADFPELGAGGAVDFCRTLEILRPLRFTGPVLLHIPGTRRQQPRPLDLCQRQVLASIEHLKMCGWFDP